MNWLRQQWHCFVNFHRPMSAVYDPYYPAPSHYHRARWWERWLSPGTLGWWVTDYRLRYLCWDCDFGLPERSKR